MIYLGEGNPFYGKKHTDESIKIIKEKRKNQKMICKKIGLYDIDKNLLKTYDGINQVMEDLQLGYKKRYYYTLVQKSTIFNGRFLSYLIK